MVMTCAYLVHKRTARRRSFNLRLTERQASDFLDARNTQQHLENSLRKQLRSRFGVRDCEYFAKILPPYGQRHRNYLVQLRTQSEVFVDAGAIDLS